MENKELNTQDTVMTPDVYKKTFWRTFPLQACFCFERMQNVGFAYMMVPALKKLYTDKKDISDALKRHLAIFNTTPAVVSFIAGASIAMEEKFKKAKDNGEEVDEESINAVKTALMGPLAGIGDSFFWGTFRIIGAGIGTSLAAKGSILGAILFLLIYNIPHLLVRYYGLKMGYKSGVAELTSNRIEERELTADDVLPGGARRVFLVREPDPSARVQCIDGHLRVGWAGDLNPAVFEARAWARNAPALILANRPGIFAKLGIAAVADFVAAALPVGQAFVASACKTSVQLAEKLDCFRSEDLVLTVHGLAHDLDASIGECCRHVVGQPFLR